MTWLPTGWTVDDAIAFVLRDHPKPEELPGIIDEAVAANPKAVQDVKAGKDRAINAIMGAVFKRYRNIEPDRLRDEIRRRIK